MIQMIRVDYRLLHGQVAVSWTSALGADCILLVSDTVLNDKLRLQAPVPCKAGGLQGRCQKHRGCRQGAPERSDRQITSSSWFARRSSRPVPSPRRWESRKINLGNVAFSENARQVSTSVFLTPETRAYVKELLGEGYELFIQMIPADAKTDAAKVIG